MYMFLLIIVLCDNLDKKVVGRKSVLEVVFLGCVVFVIVNKFIVYLSKEVKLFFKQED